MTDEILSGVEEDVSVAGEQQEEELDLFATDESGEEEEAAAEPAGEEKIPEDRVEKAFAKRLEQEREKIRREIEDQYRAQQTPQQNYQQQSPAPMQPLSKADAERLSDEFGMTVEAVYLAYNQQMAINKTNEENRSLKQDLEKLNENSTKAESLRNIEKMRKAKPGLPEVNEERLAEIRKEYKGKYGYDLPWEEAYEKLIAKEVLSGNLKREAQQETIAKIAARNKATIQAGKGGQAKKPSIDDLSADEFNKLVEEAKMGKYKKS